jgi:DMSO/TMAO reductase YedYZ molybdopterin-dependent catalytic subunit
LLAIVVFHVVITWFSLRYRRRTQRLLGRMVDPMEKVLSRTASSHQAYRQQDISPYHRVNGYPPPGQEYAAMAVDDFRDYRLMVGGLVGRPLSQSLQDLRALGDQHQVTKHNCIQGWTAVAEWAGVPLARLVAEAGPQEAARYLVFYALDDKGLTEGEGRYGFFYETIPIHLATAPQTILALDMNGAPLPIEHGAPVRLRVVTELGF